MIPHGFAWSSRFSHHGGDVKQLARHLGGDERDERGDPSLLSAKMEPGYRVTVRFRTWWDRTKTSFKSVNTNDFEAEVETGFKTASF